MSERDIHIISAKHWISYGVKPDTSALMVYLKDCENKPKKIVGAGDSLGDIILYENLRSELENYDLYNDTSVVDVLVNRNGYSHELVDYSAGNLEELGSICREVGCDLLICDGDLTLWDYSLTDNEGIREKSIIEGEISESKVKSVCRRIIFGYSTAFDAVNVGINSRQLYEGKKDNIKQLFKSVDCDVVISSMCSGRKIRKLLKDAEITV